MREPGPPVTSGATVRSISSTQPASTQCGVEARAALRLHERRRIHDVVESGEAGGEVGAAASGAHDVDRAGERRRSVLGHDQEAGARREQLARQVDVARRRDDPDALAVLSRCSVALGANRRGTDHHHVGGAPEGGEHRPVAVVAEPGRATVDGRRAVEAGDHADADPRSLSRSHPRRAVQLVEPVHTEVVLGSREDPAHGRIMARVRVNGDRANGGQLGCPQLETVETHTEFTGLSLYLPTDRDVYGVIRYRRRRGTRIGATVPTVVWGAAALDL